MEIVFSAEPKVFYSQLRYARTREHETVEFNGRTYYVCKANSYAEAIERIAALSKAAQGGLVDADYLKFINQEITKFLDESEGDNFTFMLIEFEEWHKHLENKDIQYSQTKKKTN